MSLQIRSYADAPGRRFPIDFHLVPPAEAFEGSDWVVNDIHVHGEAFAQLAVLYLEVKMDASMTQQCRRCLAPVAVAVTVDEPFELPILPDSDEVDPLPTALQMIETVHDPHVVCQADCRGLCPRCGANLNETPDHTCEKTDDERQTLRDFLT